MNRFVFLIISGSLILLTALASRSELPLFLLLPLILRFSRRDRPEKCPFEIERDITENRLRRKGETDVALTVKNMGIGSERIKIQESIPSSLVKMEGRSEIFTTLKKGDKLVLKYRIRCDRGRHRYGPVKITTWNHFGLDRRDYHIESNDEIIALPDPVQISSLPINVRKTLVYAGMNPSGRGGDGVYFHDVREYRMGDPLRHIHWSAVAKHPEKLITKEFEQERVSDIGIILDARQDSYQQFGGNAFIEQAIEAVSALSDILLSLQNRVGLMVYGRFLNWTMPGYGKMQNERIRRALATVETGNHHIFRSLKNLPTNLFPERSQLIFISPLMPDDTVFLKRLRGRGYMILVISLDCLSRADEETDHLTIDLARVERDLMIRDLERAGITVINWNLEDSIERLIQINKGRLRMAVRGGM